MKKFERNWFGHKPSLIDSKLFSKINLFVFLITEQKIFAIIFSKSKINVSSLIESKTNIFRCQRQMVLQYYYLN